MSESHKKNRHRFKVTIACNREMPPFWPKTQHSAYKYGLIIRVVWKCAVLNTDVCNFGINSSLLRFNSILNAAQCQNVVTQYVVCAHVPRRPEVALRCMFRRHFCMLKIKAVISRRRLILLGCPTFKRRICGVGARLTPRPT